MNVSVLALCFQLAPGAAPEWVQLMGVGALKAVDGRSWTNGSPEKVAAASMAAGRDLVFDYEHQTDYAPQNGQPAPAAGWIKELQVRDDGIWGRVEWTARAKQMIEAGEYRFVSPTFTFDKATKEVGQIVRAALTNAPAFQSLAALAKQEDDSMNELLKALLKKLSLSEDSNQETALAAVQTLVDQAAQAADQVKAIAKAAGLDDATKPEEIAAKIGTAIATAKTAGEPDPTKYVSADKFNQLSTDFNKLQGQLATDTATAKVDDAIAGGKLIPAQRDWAIALATKDAKGFDEFLSKQPVVVKPGGSDVPPGKRASGELDADDLAMCKTMGLDPEAYKKTLTQEIAQ